MLHRFNKSAAQPAMAAQTTLDVKLSARRALIEQPGLA
jgi:hypothetical protein